jgi:hypothetical protein
MTNHLKPIDLIIIKLCEPGIAVTRLRTLTMAVHGEMTHEASWSFKSLVLFLRRFDRMLQIRKGKFSMGSQCATASFRRVYDLISIQCITGIIGTRKQQVRGIPREWKRKWARK